MADGFLALSECVKYETELSGRRARLFASAFSFSKYLTCLPLTNYDCLLMEPRPLIMLFTIVVNYMYLFGFETKTTGTFCRLNVMLVVNVFC